MRILIFALLWSLVSTGCYAENKLQRLGNALFHPWGVSLLTKTEALVTERRGKLLRGDLSTGQRRKIASLPQTFTERQGGLLGILVHNPDTPEPDIYFCYSHPTVQGAATAVNKAVLLGDSLLRQDVISRLIISLGVVLILAAAWSSLTVNCLFHWGNVAKGTVHKMGVHTEGQWFALG